MIIDVHGHYTTAPPDLRAWRQEQKDANAPISRKVNISDDEIVDTLEKNQLKLQRDRGTDLALFSPTAGGMEHHVGDASVSLQWTQTVNDLINRVCNLYPDSFIPVCQIPQSPGVSPANCIEELERCVNELGFVGCNVNPDPSDGYWTDPPMTDKWWYPLYEKMVELDLPGLLHGGPYYYSREMEVSVYPGEVTIGGWALVSSPQVFKDFPNLKIIVGHGGGFMPYQFGRARNDRLVAMAADPSLESFEESIARLYFDTVIYNPESVEYMIDVVGVGHTLFGTDKPASGDVIDPKNGRPMNDIKNYIDAIPWLTDADRYAIYEGNARQLFSRLKLPAA